MLCVVVAVVVGAGTVVVTTVVTVTVGVVEVVVVPAVVVPDVVVPPAVVAVPVVAVVVVVVVVVSLCEVLPATADAEKVPSAASAPSAERNRQSPLHTSLRSLGVDCRLLAKRHRQCAGAST